MPLLTVDVLTSAHTLVRAPPLAAVMPAILLTQTTKAARQSTIVFRRTEGVPKTAFILALVQIIAHATRGTHSIPTTKAVLL